MLLLSFLPIKLCFLFNIYVFNLFSFDDLFLFVLTKSVITFTICNGSSEIYRLFLEISYLRGSYLILHYVY